MTVRPRVGMPPSAICHVRPQRSASQPYFSLHSYLSSGISTLPPSTSPSQSRSTAASSSSTTKSEIAGVNLKCGPPFSASISVSPSRKSTVITDPSGRPCTSSPALG